MLYFRNSGNKVPSTFDFLKVCKFFICVRKMIFVIMKLTTITSCWSEYQTGFLFSLIICGCGALKCDREVNWVWDFIIFVLPIICVNNWLQANFVIFRLHFGWLEVYQHSSLLNFQDCDAISIMKAGKLRCSKPNKYWVESSTKRVSVVL